MKKILSFFFLFTLFATSIFAQVNLKTTIGTLVSSEGGNHIGTVCLKIQEKTSCFEWASPPSTNTTKYSGVTKFQGFQNGKGWETGAEWRITYYYDKSGDKLVLSSTTFTGRNLLESPQKSQQNPVVSEKLGYIKKDSTEILEFNIDLAKRIRRNA